MAQGGRSLISCANHLTCFTYLSQPDSLLADCLAGGEQHSSSSCDQFNFVHDTSSRPLIEMLLFTMSVLLMSFFPQLCSKLSLYFSIVMILLSFSFDTVYHSSSPLLLLPVGFSVPRIPVKLPRWEVLNGFPGNLCIVLPWLCSTRPIILIGFTREDLRVSKELFHLVINH